MQLLREAIFLFLTFMDLEYTKRNMWETGDIDAELNPVIKWLVRKTNISWGVSLGILIPTSGLCAAGWYMPNFLSFLIGFRTLLFMLQLRTRNA